MSAKKHNTVKSLIAEHNCRQRLLDLQFPYKVATNCIEELKRGRIILSRGQRCISLDPRFSLRDGLQLLNAMK